MSMQVRDERFFETNEGQVLASAHMYLNAARLLVESETWVGGPLSYSGLCCI